MACINSRGGAPSWSPDGRELYYISLAKQVMAVSINTGNGVPFDPGTPVALFDASKFRSSVSTQFTPLELTPDGQRFLFTRPVAQEVRTVVVENFFDELERLLPTK